MITITKKPAGLFFKLLFVLGFIAISLTSEAVSIVVRPLTYNCAQTDTNKMQFDMYVKNTGADELGYRAHSLRFTLNRAVLPVSPLPTGNVTYVPGTGDTRLALLQATYNGASSVFVTSAVCQVNLGGGGAIYDNTTAPHVAPGDSIW